MTHGSNILFHIHVRIGEKEVELEGIREEVVSTLYELDGIVEKISDAFNLEQWNKVDEKSLRQVQPSSSYLNIPGTTKCSEAIVSLLSLKWGETPRTISELKEAMEANAVFYPRTTISGVLVWLVKSGRLRRWKDEKLGYLYVLNKKMGS